VKLLRRSAPAAAPPVDLDKPVKPGGKGRPTPKRNEARATRTRPALPADPKARKRALREERRRRSQEYRAAMASGDVSKLPPRERIPERVLARDLVDARRNVGPYFMLAALLYFLVGLVRVPVLLVAVALLMLIAIVAVIVDSVLLTRMVHRRVAERFPDSRVKVKAYAVQRALMPGRWRMPRPRVRVGQKV
jgi:hypothetical protein